MTTRESVLAPPDEPFYRVLEAATARVLMLDYDGTLSPFRTERSQATPYPGVPEALSAIVASGATRLVIVTGRALAELAPLLGVNPLPEVFASHGWERRTRDGRQEHSPLPHRMKQGLAEAARGARAAGLGARIEVKPAGVALHWRGLAPEEAEAVKSQGEAIWKSIAASSGLRLDEFDGGLELRAAGGDKGTAVRTILAESPPGAAVAYLGDDLTDEDAFKALPPNGLGVLVRARARPTTARAWLRPPDELLAFLHRWASVTGGRRAKATGGQR